MSQYRSRSAYRRRSRQRRRRRAGVSPLVVMVIIALVALLAGGAYVGYHYFLDRHPVADQCPDPDAPLTFALGARANSPDPQLPTQLDTLVSTAAKNEQDIKVYRVDGAPTLALDTTFAPTAQAGGPRAQEESTYETNVLAQMSDIHSLQTEADPLRALWLAARSTPAGGTVVLYDSGLQTTAPLDFREDGMLGADPQEVVASLGADAIPDLSGRAVVLMGIGDTASPQPQLSATQHANVVAIWQAIVAAGHPSCVQPIDTPPEPSAARVASPIVTPIQIPGPPPPPPACGSVVLYDSELGFEPDQAVLRDPGVATGYLQRLVPDIQRKQEHIHLIGTTARWGPADGQKKLGKQRAETIKGLFVQLGIPAGWITTDGVGSYSTYYRDDGGPKGPLDPAAAALNRSVIVQLICM